MYHQFSNFTGRLVSSNHVQPYFPLSPRPLDRVEPPKIIFGDSHMKISAAAPAQPAAAAVAGKGKKIQYTPLPPEFKELQRRFQVNDGVPVWLKAGARDRVKFGAICVALVITLGMSGEVFYRLITGKKD